MNLLELLICTQDPKQFEEKYTLITKKVRDFVGYKNSDGSSSSLAIIIPSMADSAAIIAMAASFAKTKDLFEIGRIIDNTITLYQRSGAAGENIKFIQELITAIINHKDFCCNFKKQKSTPEGINIFAFLSLIPMLPYSIAEAIIDGKNYMPLYEAVGKVYDKCIKEINFENKNSDDKTPIVDVTVINEQLTSLSFKTFISFQTSMSDQAMFENVMELVITEEHFNRFIDIINKIIKRDRNY